MAFQTYKDLVVWQKSVELVIATYKLTEKFPKSELFGLVSQMRRCSVSVPSNIAEGWRRRGEKEYRRFLLIAYGSGSELETQIEISKQLAFVENINYDLVDGLLNEVMRMLNKMINQK